MWTSSRSRRTSSSWMCRRSSRRCTVMPSAPPRCASTAAHTRIGLVRAARLPQRRDVVDVDSELDHGRLPCRCSSSACRSCDDAPALDAALLEVMIEHLAHQRFASAAVSASTIAPVGEREQRCAAHQRQPSSRRRRRPARPVVECVMVPRRGIHRRAGVRLAQQRQRVAELGEKRQARSVAASAPASAPAARSAERRLVAREQSRVRILARQQLQHELVQIEAAQSAAPPSAAAGRRAIRP